MSYKAKGYDVSNYDSTFPLSYKAAAIKAMADDLKRRIRRTGKQFSLCRPLMRNDWMWKLVDELATARSASHITREQKALARAMFLRDLMDTFIESTEVKAIEHLAMFSGASIRTEEEVLLDSDLSSGDGDPSSLLNCSVEALRRSRKNGRRFARRHAD